MTNVVVTASLLGRDIETVLRNISEIAGAARRIDSVTEGVSRKQVQPVRVVVSESCLQAVEVGCGLVSEEIQELQVGIAWCAANA